MRIREPNKSLTLDELRKEIEKHKEEGRKIVADIKILLSHYKKMEEYYSEWEDELNNIQNKINKASQDYGIPVKEVEEYDALSDVFGES